MISLSFQSLIDKQRNLKENPAPTCMVLPVQCAPYVYVLNNDVGVGFASKTALGKGFHVGHTLLWQASLSGALKVAGNLY